MSGKENVLKLIFTDYPEVWRETNRFRALLADYLPQDKRNRNLLMICVDERIPDELFQKNELPRMELSQLRRRLTGASGCSDMVADEVLCMWTEAFSVKVETSPDGLKQNREQLRRQKSLWHEERRRDYEAGVQAFCERKMREEIEAVNEVCKHFAVKGMKDDHYLPDKNVFSCFQELSEIVWDFQSVLDFLKWDKEMREHLLYPVTVIDVGYSIGRYYFEYYAFDNRTEGDLRYVLDLWKSCIEYAKELQSEDLRRENKKYKFGESTEIALENMGKCFYFGEIKSLKCDQSYKIKPDVALADKAFRCTYRADSYFYRGEIAEYGKCGESDEEWAITWYVSAAVKGNTAAVDKLQKKLIDPFRKEKYLFLYWISLNSLNPKFHEANDWSCYTYINMDISKLKSVEFYFLKEKSEALKQLVEIYDITARKRETKKFLEDSTWRMIAEILNLQKYQMDIFFAYRLSLNYGVYAIEKLCTGEEKEFNISTLSLPHSSDRLDKNIDKIIGNIESKKIKFSDDVSLRYSLYKIIDVLCYLCVSNMADAGMKEKNRERAVAYSRAVSRLCKIIYDETGEGFSYTAETDRITEGCLSFMGQAFYLGKIFADGVGNSFAQSYEIAFDFFDKTQTALSQYYLGEMYEYGLYVEKDIDEAFKYYGRAEKNGDSRAERKISHFWSDQLPWEKRDDWNSFSLEKIIPAYEKIQEFCEEHHLKTVADLKEFDAMELVRYKDIDIVRFLYGSVNGFMNAYEPSLDEDVILNEALKDIDPETYEVFQNLVNEINSNGYDIDKYKCSFLEGACLCLFFGRTYK